MSKKNRSRQDKTQTVKQRKNKERDKLAKQIYVTRKEKSLSKVLSKATEKDTEGEA